MRFCQTLVTIVVSTMTLAGCGLQAELSSEPARLSGRVGVEYADFEPAPSGVSTNDHRFPDITGTIGDDDALEMDPFPVAQTATLADQLTISDVRAPAPVVMSWQPNEPPITGTWLLQQGGMLATFVQGLATFGVTTDVTAMIINEDGTGRLFLRDRLTGTKDSLRMFALYDGETLVLDFAAEDTTDTVFNTAIEDYTYFFPVVVTDDQALGIADEDGHVALFTREVELPVGVTGGELIVDEVFDGLPAPQFFGDLVLFDGNLVYNSGAEGMMEVFDLDTDSLGAPLGPTSSRLVQTVQDEFLWTHCGCGGSRDAFERTLSTLVDTVSSEDEMGGPITFRAMAYDPIADRLWLHGRPFDNQLGQFFIMNTNGEPDVIERKISFNRDLRALSFDWEGQEVWGIATIASQAVVRLDPQTGQVIESYEPPVDGVSYSGLTFDEEFMYLLGTTPAGNGVIYRMLRPE